MKSPPADRPRKVGTTNAAYRFDLSGDDGGSYHIVLKDGAGEAGAGAPDSPNTTISMSGATSSGSPRGSSTPPWPS